MATNRSVYLITPLLLAALLLLLAQVAINNWSVLDTGLNPGGSKGASDIPRAQAAYSERMNGLFMVYLDEVEQAKRARSADTARWNALAAYYLAEQAHAQEAK